MASSITKYAYITLLITIGSILFFTGSFVMAIYSGISVLGIFCSVVCVLVFNGVEMKETVLFPVVCIVGLSVDYIIIVASGYQDSDGKNPVQRTMDAITESGASLAIGSICAIISIGVMWAGTTSVLHNFALVFILTIIFSFLWTFLSFMPTLMIVGPKFSTSGLFAEFLRSDQKREETNEKETDQ